MKPEERIRGNSTRRFNATLSSEKVTESYYDGFLEESMNIVPENANLSMK